MNKKQSHLRNDKKKLEGNGGQTRERRRRRRRRSRRMMTMWRQVGFQCGGCDLQHGTHWYDFYFLFSGQNPFFFFSFAKTMPPPCASHTHNNNNKISWLGTYSIHLFPYPTFTVLDTGTLPFWEYLCILGYK